GPPRGAGPRGGRGRRELHVQLGPRRGARGRRGSPEAPAATPSSRQARGDCGATQGIGRERSGGGSSFGGAGRGILRQVLGAPRHPPPPDVVSGGVSMTKYTSV